MPTEKMATSAYGHKKDNYLYIINLLRIDTTLTDTIDMKSMVMRPSGSGSGNSGGVGGNRGGGTNNNNGGSGTGGSGGGSGSTRTHTSASEENI
ncbi:hypothetical protein KUTeg_014889 [Tegillarca granosa]|uniref:Uncharacterized protein n=1 Tax=Tegillarca granosa TaxID=220873 RepID=A0ABQ9ET72_TEGGR|nr:hypothetical protein KUTeg_014889 [Tegillarca granosa]